MSHAPRRRTAAAATPPTAPADAAKGGAFMPPAAAHDSRNQGIMTCMPLCAAAAHASHADAALHRAGHHSSASRRSKAFVFPSRRRPQPGAVALWLLVGQPRSEAAARAHRLPTAARLAVGAHAGCPSRCRRCRPPLSHGTVRVNSAARAGLPAPMPSPPPCAAQCGAGGAAAAPRSFWCAPPSCWLPQQQRRPGLGWRPRPPRPGQTAPGLPIR